MQEQSKNRVKYEQSSIILQALLRQGLISEDEYTRIDRRCAEVCR